MTAPMDLIRKALDRASDAPVGAPVDMPRRSFASPPPLRQSQPKTEDGGRTQYDYVSTRRIKTDEEILKNNRIVAPFRDDTRSVAFKVLRSQILKKMRDHGWKSIAITSAKPEEGKSVVSLNLAISMSMEFNQTVLLVEADMRRPRICELLGLEAAKGLGSYLEQNVALRELLINPGMERLVVLPSIGNYPNASELLSGPRMRHLAEELKARYSDRIIIYDLPPLLGGDDALVCLPHADCVALVVGEGQSSKDEILQSRHHLRDHNVVGCILNKSTDSQPGKSYYNA
jgi:protein-tyrosine kinase